MRAYKQWSLLIFAAVLLPRLYALGTFLTIDEVKWAEGAAQFLAGLYTGDLFQTYWHFHPGVTITWGGALMLWARCAFAPDLVACAQAQVENLAESIGWLRLSPVLLTSLGITGVYLLVRDLFDHKLAWLTALLLAFDPFFIAHSRILNGDAGTAILMFLSLLAFLLYWLGPSASRKDVKLPDNEVGRQMSDSETVRPHHSLIHPRLILSGVLAGLALLTKLPAPLIGLFVGGLGLVAICLEWREAGLTTLRRWVTVLLVWGGVALLIFVILWPAMWVSPFETLRLMYVDAFEIGGVGTGHDTFFTGQVLADPGLWFYPYAVAFRLTPVVMAGVLITMGWLLLRFKFHLSQLRRHKASLVARNPLFITVLVMLAFIIFIILLSSLSPKKLDRYVMAVIPALVFLAAKGFVELHLAANRLFASHSPSPSTLLGPFLLGAGVVLQLTFAIIAAPYYLNYYNPLLGGLERAATQVPVGWGEGLEKAALYLNSLPDAESLIISSWYSDVFQSYFVGQQTSFSDDGRSQLTADYVVFYVNQIQRQKPFAGLVDYFRANQATLVIAVEPTGQVIESHTAEGKENYVHWVEVYKAPAAQSASGAPKIERVAQLLAYKVSDPEARSPLFKLLPGDAILVTLFFRVLGPQPEGSTFTVALAPKNVEADIPGLRWGSWSLTRMKGEWLEGKIVEWQGILTLPTDIPPGDYRLWVTLQFQDDKVIAELPISEKDPPLRVE